MVFRGGRHLISACVPSRRPALTIDFVRKIRPGILAIFLGFSAHLRSPANGGGALLAVLRRAERESWGGREPAPGPPLEVAPSCPRMAPHTLLCVPSNPSGKISSQSSCSPERAQHAHHASQPCRSLSQGSCHDPLTTCSATAATSVPTSGLRLPCRAAHQVSAAHGHGTAVPGPPSTGAEPAR